jgi:hypothetical protein
MRSLLILVAALLVDYSSPTHSLGVSPEEMAEARRFSDAKFRGLTPTEIGPGGLLVLANHGPMQRNGRDGAPLKIANLDFSRGLFCHAPSRILVRLPGPGKEFTASVGIDARAGGGTVVFSVHVGDSERYRSGTVRFLEPPVAVKVALQDAEQLVLEIDDAGDGISFDQSVWADAKVTLADGRELWLGDMPFWRRPYATDHRRACCSKTGGSIAPTRSSTRPARSTRSAIPTPKQVSSSG